MAAEPRVWDLPEPPGPDVTKLRDRHGTEYVREPDLPSRWTAAPERPGNGWSWQDLLLHRRPLTEVPEA